MRLSSSMCGMNAAASGVSGGNMYKLNGCDVPGSLLRVASWGAKEVGGCEETF